MACLPSVFTQERLSFGRGAQAANDCLGIAMGISTYIDEDIDAGRLVAPFDLSIPRGMKQGKAYRPPKCKSCFLQGASALDHQDCSAFQIAVNTRRGVIGVSATSTPDSRKASLTAFAIAAGGGIAPPSPSPFTPNSVNGEGVTRWSSRKTGK